MVSPPVGEYLEGIAVIGMAIRFPGADSTDAFWHNLKNGVESVTFFNDQQLESAGVDPALLKNPNYVKARPMLEGIELFDAAFFGFSPREAEVLDPQQRIFLECAWEALENAGYDSERTAYRIAVYAGTSRSFYLVHNVMPNRAVVESVGPFQALLANDKDHLATRVSYKLDLKGPSINVNTACSTSLVSVCLACQGLLNYQSDIALAGGVSLFVPQVAGYLYQEGGITSPDGHCRTFDARAKGAVFGNGAGVVVLKRVSDALADGDTIHAVIKGFAINNDGSLKVGYTAPSVEGQAEVIGEALAVAGINPESIGYIEAHGTATSMGDPIEVAALTKAFREYTEKSGFCAIGSVKTNVGHLNSAAGIAGLIKTILALEHKMLPSSLHFTAPNPAIDFDATPFFVNTSLKEWTAGPAPRRAGVSSFGIGGTNAHVILEEPPEPSIRTHHDGLQLLVLSARTPLALEAMTENIARHLESNPDVDLGDMAHTLRLGRRFFGHRRAFVCKDKESALLALKAGATGCTTTSVESPKRSVVFMFPGQGSQHVYMGLDAYRGIPTFREHIDRCAELLEPLIGVDIRDVLYPSGVEIRAAEQMNETLISQPAIFAVEYALAKMWMHWGVRPRAMIGHSIGEYVAGCLAQVFSLEDALGMIAARGKLLQELPRGSMLAVALPEVDLLPLLGNSISIAAVNARSLCTLSGPRRAVEELERQLTERGISYQRIHTSHAYHSQMMEPVIRAFKEHVAGVQMNPPGIPYISCLTGTWVTDGQATDPDYWGKHLRHCVRFSAGLERIIEDPDRVLLEVGPGQDLCSLAKEHTAGSVPCYAFSSLPHPKEKRSAEEHLLNSVGQLWSVGVDIDWTRFHAGENLRRIPLPTYPFERRSFWIEAAKQPTKEMPQPTPSILKLAFENWFNRPVWNESPLIREDLSERVKQKHCSLVFLDDCGVGLGLAERLRGIGQDVITVEPSTAFDRVSEHTYTIDGRSPGDYHALLEEIKIRTGIPQTIWHLWGISQVLHWSMPDHLERTLDLGFYSLIHLAQALGRQSLPGPVQVVVVTNGMQGLGEGETICPEKATLLGPCRVIPKEYPNVNCRSIDILLPAPDASWENLIDALLEESLAGSTDPTIAYRDDRRWVEDFEPVHLDGNKEASAPLRKGGVYLITGGLGGIGLVLAKFLARTVQAKLVLVGRSFFPGSEEWESRLSSGREDDPLCRRIRKVQAIESLGSEVLTVRADVCNRSQMEEALALAGKRFGDLNGVIHAAGVPDGAVIQRRTREMTDAVLAPKIRGTLVLDDLLKGAGLDFFMLCSSIASVLGPFGQVGYCAANAYMDAYAYSRFTKSPTLVTSINWDVWRDVGMAVRQMTSPAVVMPLAATQPVEVGHPLVEQRLSEDYDHEVFLSYLSVKEHWVLDEHRIAGKPTLPGTAYIEIIRAALEAATGARVCEIRDLYFLRPMLFGETEQREVRTMLSRRKEGYDFTVSSRSNQGEEAWQEHVQGKVSPLEQGAAPSKNLDAVMLECDRKIEAFTAATFKRKIKFGPRWRCINDIRLGDGQGLADLKLKDAFLADTCKYILHPALLDIAAGFLIPALGSNEAYLPFFYKRITVRGPLPLRIFSYASIRDRGHSLKEIIKLDISIMDDKGVELVEIEEYALRKVDIDKVIGIQGRSGIQEKAVPADVLNCRLEAASPGSLDSLLFRSVKRPNPKAGEIEIEVLFAGLNFKDVLLALDLLPGMRDAFPLGMECTGRIVSVGEGVEEFKIGDEVMAFAPAAFSSYVVTPASAISKRPFNFTLEEAATIPVAYMTAYYALVKSGRLSQGERVLIHAATGGVGMAAVKIAQWVGAEIFATAGSPEKRALLRSLGIEHVMDSRSLAFADEIMECTKGAGVHVVLNSLAGDFIPKSLSVLTPYGRFIEIGVRDILLDRKLSLGPFAKCLSFTSVMLGPQLPHFSSIWQELVEHLTAGNFAPLPYRVFRALDVTLAFNHMAQAKHTGKILISMEDREALFEKAASADFHPLERDNPAAVESALVHHLAPVRGDTHRHNETKVGSAPLYSLDAGISSSEGAKAFGGMLAVRLPQIIVSTHNFRARLELSRSFSINKLQHSSDTAGKVAHARPELRTAYVAPRTETERKIAELWQQLFGIDLIGINDNFFELGGHSLLAVQINSKIREIFRVELPTDALFEQPTVAVLAEQIDALLKVSDSPVVPAVREGGREEFLL